MKPLPLVLGGRVIEPHCGPIRMRYEAFGGSEELRMADGTGYKQTHWRKTRITASGAGPLEPALEGLDFSRPLELWCVKPQSTGGSARLYEIPAPSRRRPDVAPWGLALVGERWLDTPLQLVDNLAELSPVAGAIAYRVVWQPRFWVLSDGVVGDWDEARGLYEWSLEARER